MFCPRPKSWPEFGAGRGTGPFKSYLPMPGFHKFPASGKHIALPKEGITITVRNGKIARLESEVVPGGGVNGVLAQLGVPVPQIA